MATEKSMTVQNVDDLAATLKAAIQAGEMVRVGIQTSERMEFGGSGMTKLPKEGYILISVGKTAQHETVFAKLGEVIQSR